MEITFLNSKGHKLSFRKEDITILENSLKRVLIEESGLKYRFYGVSAANFRVAYFQS